MTTGFSSRLAERLRQGMGPAVVGLDPRPDALPAGAGSAVERIARFYRQALPILAEHVPAVKPNVAFFECLGADGFRLYEQTCRLARELGLLVIGDVKRGDIGSTARAYAAFHLDVADAVTLHPYLGTDSLQPFFDRCRTDGKAVFVLVKTSNPSASELQDVDTAGGRLCEVVARAVERWGAELGTTGGYSPVGAVVGATRPDDVARLRGLMQHAWLLLPGVGAQGAAIEDTAAAFDRTGLGGLISQSRSIMQCFEPDDAGWPEALERAAGAFSQQARRVASAGSEGSQP